MTPELSPEMISLLERAAGMIDDLSYADGVDIKKFHEASELEVEMRALLPAKPNPICPLCGHDRDSHWITPNDVAFCWVPRNRVDELVALEVKS